MSTILNNFPKGLRGTFTVYNDYDDKGSWVTARLSDKMLFVKKLINDRARDTGQTIIVRCEMRGSGWVILWWPASEPRHEIGDEILIGETNYGR